MKNVGMPFYIQRGLALMALICLSPILGLTALLIALESRGGVIFKQRRVGQHGRQFEFIKFRSMRTPTDPKYREPRAEDSDRQGVCAKYLKDPRITTIGQFIRKFSIDELPQLWNVVKGDMALVGPRPALVSEVEAYEQTDLDRLNAMPGLTGLWQVSGRADTTFIEQVKLDLEYIERQSGWYDLLILFKTIPAVLTARGAY